MSNLMKKTKLELISMIEDLTQDLENMTEEKDILYDDLKTLEEATDTFEEIKTELKAMKETIADYKLSKERYALGVECEKDNWHNLLEQIINFSEE